MKTFALLYLFSCLLLMFRVTTEVKIQDITDEPDEHTPIQNQGKKINQSKEYQGQLSKNKSPQYFVEEPTSQDDESKMQLALIDHEHDKDPSQMQIVLANNGLHVSELKDHNNERSNEDLNLHDDQGNSSEQNITPLGIVAMYDWWSRMPQSGLNQIRETGHGAGSSMDPVTRARILKANITPKGMEILQEWSRDIPIMDMDQSEDEKPKDTVIDKNTQTEAKPSKSNDEAPSNTDNTSVQDVKLPGLKKSKSDVNNSPREPDNFVLRRTVHTTDDNGNTIFMRRTEANFIPESEPIIPNYNIPGFPRFESPYVRQPPRGSRMRNGFPGPSFNPQFFAAPRLLPPAFPRRSIPPPMFRDY